jgi:uncharacterized membrane protein YdbT with pleckstrin-like domain
VSVTQNLISGESIVFESKKHWMAPIRASLVAGLMIIGAWLLWLIAPGGGEGLFGTIGGALGSLMNIAAIVLLIAGVGWIIYNIVAWRTAEFAVTNMRVLREEGLLSKRSSTTLLSSLSDVRTKVNFLGERLDYGDIILLTTSGQAGIDRFLTITKPNDFRNAVMNQKMATGGNEGLTPRPAAAAVAAEPAPTTAATAPAMTSTEAADALDRLADLHARGALTDAEFEAKKTELLARM